MADGHLKYGTNVANTPGGVGIDTSDHQLKFMDDLAVKRTVVTLLQTQTLSNKVIAAGSGSTTASMGGTLTTNTTTVGTPASTTETDLWTYSLPANTLSADGRGVRVTVFGTTAANANSKTVTLYFGATAMRAITATANSSTWTLEGVVLRTGASAQLARAQGAFSAGTYFALATTPAESTTGAITIKVTGTNGVATANDILFKGAIVEYV